MSWLLLAAYVLGLPVAFRVALRRHMLEPICERCYHNPYHIHAYYHPGDAAEVVNERTRCVRVPRGSIRDRSPRDLRCALRRATFWPLTGAFWIILLIRDLIVDGALSLTDRLLPPTAPELERRIREQREEIKRLTEQIGDGS